MPHGGPHRHALARYDRNPYRIRDATDALACLVDCGLLAGCGTTPAPRASADIARCDALAGAGWQRIEPPEVAAELLTLAHVTTAPALARWYVAAGGAHAACVPPEAAAICGHALHIFQPQVHRM